MRFIERFCKAINIEVPKNERTSDLIIGVVSVWAIVLLGYFAMWVVYGG
jgi:hypothetical protein